MIQSGMMMLLRDVDGLWYRSGCDWIDVNLTHNTNIESCDDDASILIPHDNPNMDTHVHHFQHDMNTKASYDECTNMKKYKQ